MFCGFPRRAPFLLSVLKIGFRTQNLGRFCSGRFLHFRVRKVGLEIFAKIGRFEKFHVKIADNLYPTYTENTWDKITNLNPVFIIPIFNSGFN
jgi:hypothetical protein